MVTICAPRRPRPSCVPSASASGAVGEVDCAFATPATGVSASDQLAVLLIGLRSRLVGRRCWWRERATMESVKKERRQRNWQERQRIYVNMSSEIGIARIPRRILEQGRDREGGPAAANDKQPKRDYGDAAPSRRPGCVAPSVEHSFPQIVTDATGSVSDGITESTPDVPPRLSLPFARARRA